VGDLTFGLGFDCERARGHAVAVGFPFGRSSVAVEREVDLVACCWAEKQGWVVNLDENLGFAEGWGFALNPVEDWLSEVEFAVVGWAFDSKPGVDSGSGYGETGEKERVVWAAEEIVPGSLVDLLRNPKTLVDSQVPVVDSIADSLGMLEMGLLRLIAKNAVAHYALSYWFVLEELCLLALDGDQVHV